MQETETSGVADTGDREQQVSGWDRQHTHPIAHAFPGLANSDGGEEQGAQTDGQGRFQSAICQEDPYLSVIAAEHAVAAADAERQRRRIRTWAAA